MKLDDELRNLPRALMGGTLEMVKRGVEFLPQHHAESDISYKARLHSTTLYNGFQDTVKKMAGKPFGKPIEPNDDVPQSILALLPNIDGAGRNLTSFMFDTFEEAIIDGISFVFVDHPVVTKQATMADVKAQGVRPYVVIVKAGQLLEWYSTNIGGVQTLTEAHIFETVDQKRVLYPGRFEIQRKNAVGEWFVVDQGVTSLSYIPLIPVYVNRSRFYEGKPPLIALADLNKEHWISSSEQRKACTYARFAMLCIAGADGSSKVDVGPDKVLMLPAGAVGTMLETSGAALEAGRKDLEAIEQRMQHVGMTIRVQTKAGVTATEAKIDSKDSDSALMAAVTGLEDSTANILQVFADYMKETTGGTVSVNKSFSDDVPQGTMTDVLQMHASGVLQRQSVLDEAKRRGILSDAFDVAAEMAHDGVIL